MKASGWKTLGWALFLAAIMPGAATAAPPTQQAIIKACDEAGNVAQCERLLEAEQIKRFPAIATRESNVLRLKSHTGMAPLLLRDTGDPGNETGAAYRSHAFWDYWPQKGNAVVSVTTQNDDYYLVVDLDRGTQTKVAAEPLLGPDRQRFLVADLCEKKCADLIQIWRFDRDSLVRERTFRPSEKWYEAEVSWRDATTLAIEYSVAAPRRRLAEPGELILERAKPRLLKLSDAEWMVDEARR